MNRDPHRENGHQDRAKRRESHLLAVPHAYRDECEQGEQQNPDIRRCLDRVAGELVGEGRRRRRRNEEQPCGDEEAQRVTYVQVGRVNAAGQALRAEELEANRNGDQHRERDRRASQSAPGMTEMGADLAGVKAGRQAKEE